MFKRDVSVKSIVKTILTELREHCDIGDVYRDESRDIFKKINKQMATVVKQQEKMLKAMEDLVGEIESAEVMDEQNEMEMLKYFIRTGFETGSNREELRKDAIGSGYSEEEFEKVLDELDKQDEERNRRRGTKKDQ